MRSTANFYLPSEPSLSALLVEYGSVRAIKLQEARGKITNLIVAEVAPRTVLTQYGKIRLRVFRRRQQHPGLRGESAKMTPGRPENGSIESSSYGRLIDSFAAGLEKARKLFAARRTKLFTQGIPHELTMETAGPAILYFPHEGMSAAGRARYKNEILRKKP